MLLFQSGADAFSLLKDYIQMDPQKANKINKIKVVLKMHIKLFKKKRFVIVGDWALNTGKARALSSELLLNMLY